MSGLPSRRLEMADTLALAEPSSALDVFESAYDEIALNRYRARFNGLAEPIYDREIERIKALTGVEIANPYRYTKREMMAGNAEGITGSSFERFEMRRQRLAEQRPEIAGDIAADRHTLADLYKRQEALEKAGQEAIEASPMTINLWWNVKVNPIAMAGGMAAAFEDPMGWLENLVGFGGAATQGARGLLWASTKAAAANAGVTAVAQPFVQDWRRQAGLEFGLQRAATETLLAGLVGGVLDAGTRAGLRVVQPRRGLEPVLDPETRTIQGWRRPGQADGDPVLPAAPDPAQPPPARSLADPIAALDDGAARLPPEHPVARAAAGDDEALLAVARDSGALDADPAVRGAAQELERFRLFGPPPEVDPLDHYVRLAEAIQRSADPEAPPPGRSFEPPPAEQWFDPDTQSELLKSDVDGIVDMWRFVKDVRGRPKPESLSSFIVRAGGVNDEHTEVRYVIGGAKARPGLVNRNGIDLDTAARLAWDAGFLPGAERPTVADFLDALDKDVRGNAVYRDKDIGAIDDIRIADEMERDLVEFGLGAAKSADDVYSRFARKGGEGPGGPQAAAGAALPPELAAARQRLIDQEGSPVDMALIMREVPQLVDRSLHLSDHKTKQALALSQLSPEAFELVAGGLVAPNHAALVARHVADAGRHAEVLQQIAASSLKSEAQVKMLIGEVTARAGAADVHAARTGAEAPVRELMPQRVEALDGALRLIAKDARVGAVLDREVGRLEAALPESARGNRKLRAELGRKVGDLIEVLSREPGRVSDLVQDAALARASGTSKRDAARQLAKGLADIIDNDGLGGLARVEPRPAETLVARGFSKPDGPEAKAQAEMLQRARAADPEAKPAGPAKALDAEAQRAKELGEFGEACKL